MGYKKDDPCLQKAYDDEKLFVLMARDDKAPRTILHWISESFYDQPDAKLREAFECALEMKHNQKYFRLEATKEKFGLPK